MEHKALQIILVGLLFFACNKSSGALNVLKLGPDTYLVTVGSSWQAEAKDIAVTKANQYCSSLDKEILVSNISSSVSHRIINESTFPTHTVDITFRCLSKDDPSLERPTYQKAPSVVIEDRRN